MTKVDPDLAIAAAINALNDCVAAAGRHDPSQNNYAALVDDLVTARTAPIPQPVTPFMAPRHGQIGMARLDAVVRNIKNIAEIVLDKPLTKNQQTTATQFILNCLPKIVTVEEYIQYREDYYLFLGIDPSEINVPVDKDQPASQTSSTHRWRDCRCGASLMPRQCGKTTIVAICCAAILVSCPGITIGNFASQLHQAEILQTQIIKNIIALQEGNRGMHIHIHTHRLIT